MTSCNYNYNECEAKSNKWSNIAFYYLLDIIRINCQTLWSLNYQKNPRKTDSRTFGLDLARALFIPAIRNRSLHGLSTRTLTNCYLETEDRKFLRSTADTSRDPNTPLLPSVSPGLPSRCVQCVKDASGPGYKMKVSGLSRVKSQCQSCGLRMCTKVHLISLCDSCK